jgi:hypothetical protein
MLWITSNYIGVSPTLDSRGFPRVSTSDIAVVSYSRQLSTDLSTESTVVNIVKRSLDDSGTPMTTKVWKLGDSASGGPLAACD